MCIRIAYGLRRVYRKFKYVQKNLKNLTKSELSSPSTIKNQQDLLNQLKINMYKPNCK